MPSHRAASGGRPRPVGRRTVLLSAAALGAGAALGTSAALGAGGGGARVTGEEWLDERTVDLTVDSPAVGEALPVRVLLPASHAADPGRTRPLLQLLHGAHDDYTSWTRETEVADFLASEDVVAVLPSSGPTGIPTAWWEFGRQDAPDYEAFQMEELPPLLLERFGAEGPRAVAGVSTGGYGALALAARHPGAFAAAASYSGIVDTTAPGMPVVVSAIVARESLLPSALWGSPALHRANWDRRNPRALAHRLAGTRLYVSQGSGVPGGDFGNLEGALLEGTLWAQARAFTRRLAWLGVEAQTNLYRGGSHAWPYWWREFQASWPLLAAGLGLR